MRAGSWAAIGLGLVLTAGCTHSLHQYHVSDSGDRQPARAAKRQTITAESDQFVVLGFTGNTDYVDKVFEQLRSKCPDGEIVNIHTRYSTSLAFLSYTNKIHVQASCVHGG